VHVLETAVRDREGGRGDGRLGGDLGTAAGLAVADPGCRVRRHAMPDHAGGQQIACGPRAGVCQAVEGGEDCKPVSFRDEGARDPL
jgi:hypothetical protein